METLLKDLRLAIRYALRRPRLSILVIGSLTVGVGFAATVFGFLDALFFRSLPIDRPDRVVAIYGLDEANPGFLPVSYPNVQDIEAASDSLARLAVYQWTGVKLWSGDRSESILVQIVSDDFFELLGVDLGAGRAFTTGDEDAVVLGHTLAKRLFGLDPRSAIGETVVLNDARYTVVGVAVPSFKGVGAMGMVAELWLPMGVFERVSRFGHLRDDRSARIFGAVGRLTDGADPRGAERELDQLATHLRSEFPNENPGLGLAVRPLDESVVDPNQRERFVFGGRLVAGLAALLVLLACFNASNLLLIQAIRARGEVAVRLALGAKPTDLLRQLLLQGAVLVLAGGALGFGVAVVAQKALWANRPANFAEDYLAVEPNPRILLFALLAALLAGMLASVAPTLELRRHDLVSRLKAGGVSTTGRSPRFGVRNLLVALQVGLAVIGLTAAVLFTRNLDQALDVDLGMNKERLLLLQYDLSGEQYSDERSSVFGREMVARTASLPGVERAALAAYPPLNPFSMLSSILIPGRESADESPPVVTVNPVSPGYFETTGLSIIRGRDFTPDDRFATVGVAVINQAMAERFWSGPDEAVGRTFFVGTEKLETRIVGVATDSKYQTLGEERAPYIYVPVSQHPRPRMTLHVRTRSDPEILLETVRRQAQSLDPTLTLSGVQTLTSRIRESLWAARLAALLAGLVAVVCSLLASAGIYGAIDFAVRERKRELAIRMALGGRLGKVVGIVVTESMTVVAVGTILGVTLAAYLLRLTRSFLFGLQPLDPATWITAVTVFGLVALVASYLPARKIARIDPAVILGER